MGSSSLIQGIFDTMVPAVEAANAYGNSLMQRFAANVSAAQAIALANDTMGAWFLHLELTTEPGQVKAGALSMILKGRLGEAKVVVDNYPGIVSWKVTGADSKLVDAAILDFSNPEAAPPADALADQLTRMVLLAAPTVAKELDEKNGKEG